MALSTLGSAITATSKPLYLKNRDIYKGGEDRISSYEICKSALEVVGERNIEGAQLIRGVWKLYTKTETSHIKLLQCGLTIRGMSVNLYEDNPYTRKTDDDPVEKIIIKDLPLELDNAKIENALKEHEGLVLKSHIMFSKIRDQNGKWTNFKNGDRFVYVLAPIITALPKEGNISGHACRFIHNSQEENCKACQGSGHRTLAEGCPAKADESDIALAFRGYQHVLSNHYECKVKVFDQEFESSEHAFLWKKWIECGHEDIAIRIKMARHAGAAKLIDTKQDSGKVTKEWLDKQIDIMHHILKAKARQIPEFARALKESGQQLLAEANRDPLWATGHFPFITSRCKPEYWPGDNMLGQLLMKVRRSLQESKSDTIDDTLLQEIENSKISLTDEIETDTEDEKDNAYEEELSSKVKKISPGKKLLKRVGNLFGSNEQKKIPSFFGSEKTKKRKPSTTPPKDKKKTKEDNICIDNPSSPFVVVENMSQTTTLAENKQTSNHPPKSQV